MYVRRLNTLVASHPQLLPQFLIPHSGPSLILLANIFGLVPRGKLSSYTNTSARLGARPHGGRHALTFIQRIAVLLKQKMSFTRHLTKLTRASFGEFYMYDLK